MNILINKWKKLILSTIHLLNLHLIIYYKCPFKADNYFSFHNIYNIFFIYKSNTILVRSKIEERNIYM